VTKSIFLGSVSELLLKRDGFIDIRGIVGLGKDNDALTAPEIADLERRNTLPGWMLDELSLRPSFQQTTRAMHATLQQGSTYPCKPAQQFGAGSLPPAFGQASGKAPDVSVTTGRYGTFTLQNFLKIALMGDGFIPEISDRNGLWAWEVFKHRKPVRLTGSTLVCITEGSVVFTHWLLDTLPRFEIARMAGYALGDFDNIVLATARLPFHMEGLAALGVDESRVYTRDELGPVIECDQFCVTSMPRRNFLADPWVYDFVNTLFGNQPEVRRNRRIFISRGATARRQLYNEAELLPVLDSFGVEIVMAEQCSVRQMRQLCAEASHIIAPHGAGLSNIVFMPAGGTVLELYGAHISPEYWLICSQRDHHYACLQGADADGAPFTQSALDRMGFFERNALGYRIDPSLFAHALGALLADSPGHQQCPPS
jgi:hypothetical protein